MDYNPQAVLPPTVIIIVIGQGPANFLSQGPKNEMISLGGPQLLSKAKLSAHFNIVLLYLSKNYASEQI